MRSRIHLWLRTVVVSLLIVPFLVAPSHAATAAPADTLADTPADIDDVVGDFEYGTQGWTLGLGPEFPAPRALSPATRPTRRPERARHC